MNNTIHVLAFYQNLPMRRNTLAHRKTDGATKRETTPLRATRCQPSRRVGIMPCEYFQSSTTSEDSKTNSPKEEKKGERERAGF